jgi:hypothetical protein
MPLRFKKNNISTTKVDHFDPGPPKHGEIFGKRSDRGLPANEIEGSAEMKFENCSRASPSFIFFGIRREKMSPDLCF